MSIVTQNGFRKAYDGAIRLAQDISSPTIFGFPGMGITIQELLGNYYPTVIDASANRLDKVPGFRYGQIGLSTPVKVENGLGAFLTAAFGPRTAGKLAPWIGTFVPYNSGTPEIYPGIWFDTARMSGRFGTNGQTLMHSLSLSAMTIDPTNALAATALSAPTSEGVTNGGLSTFANTTFSNGAASSPTVYDGVRSYNIVFANGMTPDPAAYPGQVEMIAGYTPDQFIGSLSLSQLQNCTNALPQAAGTYPLTITIPSGDGAHTLRIDMSASFDSVGVSLSPQDYGTQTYNYTLFGTQTVNLATAFSFACTYA